MAKKYNHYFFTSANKDWWISPWPNEIDERFRVYRGNSLTTSYLFEEGSDEEQFFLDAVKKNSIKTDVEVLFDLKNNEIKTCSHYLLFAKEGISINGKEIMDDSNTCGGNKDYYCPSGKIQTKKLIFSYNKINKLDIMFASGYLNPRIIIVSKKMKKLLELHSFSGFRLIPCLDAAWNIDSHIDLNVNSSELDERADYFQLVICENVIHPPKLKWFSKGRSCPECGEVLLFLGMLSAYVNLRDLHDLDFQKYSSMIRPDGNIQKIASENIIVSSRFIQLIVDNKLRGLDFYNQQPKLKYCPILVADN